jgi:hypothetical protein
VKKGHGLPCFSCGILSHKGCISAGNKHVLAWITNSGNSFVCKACTVTKYPERKLSQEIEISPSDSEDDVNEKDIPGSSKSKQSRAREVSDELPAWKEIVREESAKSRRKREIVVAGLRIMKDRRDDASTHYVKAHKQIHHILTSCCMDVVYKQTLTTRFSWRYLGKINPDDRRPPLILLSFSDEITVRNLLHTSSALLDNQATKNVFLRESLSKEERRAKAIKRLSKKPVGK